MPAKTQLPSGSRSKEAVRKEGLQSEEMQACSVVKGTNQSTQCERSVREPR